jgi:hypothetical protein
MPALALPLMAAEAPACARATEPACAALLLDVPAVALPFETLPPLFTPEGVLLGLLSLHASAAHSASAPPISKPLAMNYLNPR